MLKRFFSIFTISLILTGSFFSIYSFEYPVYADSTTDEWMNVTTNEQLVEAFRYYCKSRDLTIEGSVADGVTSFTTQTFNSLCNTLGIDVTALQAHLKYTTDSNLGLRFLFDSTGITAYNRIFSQFLQDNDLEVGDQVEDEEIYNGKWFVDADGNGCLVYTDPTNLVGSNNSLYYGYDVSFSSFGTDYRFSSEQIINYVGNSNFPITFHLTQNSSYSTTLTYYSHSTTQYNEYTITDSTSYDAGFRFYRKTIKKSDNSEYYPIKYGKFIVSQRSGDLYLSVFARNTSGLYIDADNTSPIFYRELKKITSPDSTTVNVYITTNNTTINNNNYEGDTIINNNGDTNNYPDDPDDPDNPDNPDNPTPDPPTIPDSGGWQDFSLPEMPNDWLIYGMERKFPFDIPFNIMFALSLLNHEPEIPKFEGDIDLQVCTWHYDIDLTPFDDLAKILRKFEVLAFIIGLAILTKNLINWG